MENLIKNTLKEKIQKTGHHPFLFIGSGFSHRYMGTKNWVDLLKYFCVEFSGDEFKYSYYTSLVNGNEFYGKEPKIASLLEKDYAKAVYTLDKYNTFKQENKDLIHQNVSVLKIAIANHLKKINFDENLPEIKLLKEISKRHVAGIITTNYDNLLDAIFEGYKSYIGQEELIFTNLTGVGEIYKIHGSVDKPESIIITEEDYKKFEELSAYLIAKILTIFLEYPIVFIGYSLQDKNIRNILETISKCLPQNKLDLLKDRFLFIDYADEQAPTEKEFEFSNGKQIIMTKFSTKNFLPIYEAIYEVKSLYSPKVLRRLRKDIYEIAQIENPKSKIVVKSFEGLDDLPEDSNIIIGIGTSNIKNGHLVKANEIYEDIIMDNHLFNPKLVIEEYLPELLKQNTGGLPMHKYIAQYEGNLYERVEITRQKYQTIDSFLNKVLRQSKISYRNKYDNHLSVDDVIKIEGFDLAYKRLIFLNDDEINSNLDELHAYLKSILTTNGINFLNNNSELKRLIRMYDLAKYKQ